jgi:hypothetical protein
MSQHRLKAWIAAPLAACLLLATTSSMAAESPAADSGDTSSEPRTATGQKIDVEKLRKQIAEQQRQIDAMQKMLADQKRLLDAVSDQNAEGAVQPRPSRAPLGEVASTTPMIPAGPAPMDQPVSAKPKSEEKTSPLQFSIGNATILPIGFMDATAVWRDKAAGSSIGTNFGSIPFNNVPAAHLNEFRFSPQNSRIGFRVDGDWKGAHFIGYNEMDFLGSSGSNAIGVSNGAFVPRLRLFWVDVRKDQWEVLAGQSWTMMTPNRKGISALPGDLFYSQVIDVNYMIGLPWARTAGARVLYHPSDKVTFGLSFENPDQYIGGSGGGPTIVLPAALASLAGTQFDNSTNVLVTPNVHPDIVAKLAFDPNSRIHVEIAGMERTFKDWNPVTGVYSTKAGGAGSINASLEVVKNFRLITTNFWSDGGGRYLFGNAPDLVVRADGSISPIHSSGTVDGFEAQVTKKTLLYAYYGGIYISRNVAIDANGTSLVGYGYTKSANSQNRTVQEGTFGFNQTLWKDPKYGAINFMGQYQYTSRNPWYVAVGAPKSAHDNTIYFNLRYLLPGSAPTMGK